MSKKENLKRILLCVFVIALSLVLVSWASKPNANESKENYTIPASVFKNVPTLDSVCVTYSNDTINANQDSIDLEETVDILVNKQDSIKDLLMKEVNMYVKKQAPGISLTIPNYIVEKCLTSDIDICFMMSQTQVETNFGTAGAGRECSRRSLFGVARRSYTNYTTAIDDYVSILKKSYLVKGRTEKDLMRNYVTGSGYRYASSRTYEGNLTRTYNGIKAKTKIYELQQQYKKLS